MALIRNPKWTDAQWEAQQYWSNLTKYREKVDRVRTKQEDEREKRRQRVARIQESKERWDAIKEVWE